MAGLVMVWCLGDYWLVFGWPDRWWFGVWVVVVIGDWCLGSRFFFVLLVVVGVCVVVRWWVAELLFLMWWLLER